MKKKIFDIIQIGDKSNLASRTFDIVIVLNIVINITVMLLDTFQELHRFSGFFKAVELVTTGFFCVEYLLRIWTADLLYQEKSRLRSVLRFLISYDGIVDLFTIIPVFFLSGFVVLRMLRVVRIFHLFRLNVRKDSFHVITSVLYESRRQLTSSVFIMLVLMFASSLCMYSAEHNAQPDVFENAFSGLWWSVSTVLTVGYGDIYPVTVVGRLMAIVTAITGVGLVAIPTGIISAGFITQYQRESASATACAGKVRVMGAESLQGRTVGSVRTDLGYNILAVNRDGVSLLPTGDLVLKATDKLILE